MSNPKNRQQQRQGAASAGTAHTIKPEAGARVMDPPPNDAPEVEVVIKQPNWLQRAWGRFTSFTSRAWNGSKRGTLTALNRIGFYSVKAYDWVSIRSVMFGRSIVFGAAAIITETLASILAIPTAFFMTFWRENSRGQYRHFMNNRKLKRAMRREQSLDRKIRRQQEVDRVAAMVRAKAEGGIAATV